MYTQFFVDSKEPPKIAGNDSCSIGIINSETCHVFLAAYFRR